MKIIPKRFSLMRYIEFTAVLVGFAAFIIDFIDRDVARTSQAWQVLALEAHGGMGKYEAIDYLNKLSCWRVLKDLDSNCSWLTFKNRNSLRGIVVPPNTVLEGINLEDAELPQSDFRGVYLATAIFRNANLRHADFRGSDLFQADFTDAEVKNADFRGARLSCVELRKAKDWKSSCYDKKLSCDSNRGKGDAIQRQCK